MTRKELIIIVIIVLLIIVILFAKNKSKIDEKAEENISRNSVRTEYNDDEGKYVVYDETGREIYNGTNKAEAEFRERHPDFDPMIDQFDSDDGQIGDLNDGQFSKF